MNTPFIWVYAASTSELYVKMQRLAVDSPEYLEISDYVIRQNLIEQQRLLLLVGEFYDQHTPTSPYSRLIIQTSGDEGESNLVPQGASVRIVLPKDKQLQLHKEFLSEMKAFGDFLSAKKL